MPKHHAVGVKVAFYTFLTAALGKGKGSFVLWSLLPPVHNGWEFGWISELVLAWWYRDKLLPPGNRKLIVQSVGATFVHKTAVSKVYLYSQMLQ